MRAWSRAACRMLLPLALVACARSAAAAPSPRNDGSPPNILFIILDDVGVDQLSLFNPSRISTTPRTPSIDAIAGGGVTFTSFYAMPECSPSRVAFFTGRYPFRTGVKAAILPEDLPSSQLSPFETTIPMVLATGGYANAMVGKYHLGGPDNNPHGYRTPQVAGWDYYVGNFSGGPPYLDTTLGGQYTLDTDRYSCGLALGRDRGACWRRDGNQQPTLDTNGGVGYTGKQCASSGGIPALDADGDLTLTCPPETGCRVPSFGVLNGYYVWPRVEVEQFVVRQTTSRKYMTVAETDAALAWMRRQSRREPDRPWMLTVSYSSDHIPYQPPPDGLLRPGAIHPPNCTDPVAQRLVSDQMIEAMDHEIGRLLVGAGLATRRMDGSLDYSPEQTDTMVVVVGDNGSFLPSVKVPYNPVRSKASVYETGLLTPLIVAGPLVESPGRTVEELVSAVDLFSLFGEIAGIEVRAVVPREHVLDARPVLPYLESASQKGLRPWAFAEVGHGNKAPSVQIWPCVLELVIDNICTDSLLTTEDLCVAVGGRSFGPVGYPPDGLEDCCAVKEAQPPIYENLTLVPNAAWAIRDQRYKLIVNDRAPCDSPPEELYDLQATRPLNPLGLDNEADDLLAKGPLDARAQAHYEALHAALEALLASEVECPGDGNLDKRVDRRDAAGVQRYLGGPSVFDFDDDGVTDEQDLEVVEANFGRVCKRPAAGG